jgi:hypothetical protein
MEKLGAMAHKLELPPSLAVVHVVFHISQLKKSLKAPTNVVVNDIIPLEADLSYPKHSVKLLGLQDRAMQRRTRFNKVQWSRHFKQEATWETEDFLHFNYSDFLPL